MKILSIIGRKVFAHIRSVGEIFFNLTLHFVRQSKKKQIVRNDNRIIYRYIMSLLVGSSAN